MRVFEDTLGFVRRCMCVACEVCVCECAHLNKIYDKANDIVAVLLKVYEQVDGNSRLQVGTG